MRARENSVIGLDKRGGYLRDTRAGRSEGCIWFEGLWLRLRLRVRLRHTVEVVRDSHG